jgi:hypothetical protein
MLVTCLRIEGKDFNSRRAAREIGLGRDAYFLKGELIRSGPKKGRKHRVSHLVIGLSDNDGMPEHMAEVERELDDLWFFLAKERRKSKSPLNIWVSAGMGVGGAPGFARGIRIPPDLPAKLAAMDIACEIWGYPCSDE